MCACILEYNAKRYGDRAFGEIHRNIWIIYLEFWMNLLEFSRNSRQNELYHYQAAKLNRQEYDSSHDIPSRTDRNDQSEYSYS